MLIESFGERIRKVEFLYYNNGAHNHERCIGIFMLLKGHVLKLLSRNKILTSIKGYNSVTNKQNMEDSNPNIYLINIYIFAKIRKILSICPQDIAQKQNSVANQGP